MYVKLFVVPAGLPCHDVATCVGDAFLAFNACGKLADHRVYRLPHRDMWRLEGTSVVERTEPLAVTYGAPLDAPGRRTAMLRFGEGDRPGLEGLRLEPVHDGLLASLLATGGGAGRECWSEPHYKVKTWVVGSERRCSEPSKCEPEALYVSVADCRVPLRHAVFQFPDCPHWDPGPVGGFDESSGSREDVSGNSWRRDPPGEVLLEWRCGFPTENPTHRNWWDWTEFEVFVSPERARLVRKEVLPSGGN